MKNYLIFIFISITSFLIVSCGTTIDDDEERGNIRIVQGHLTYKGENFTGTYIKKWPKEYMKGNHVLLKYKFKNGLPDGIQEVYFCTGQLFKTFNNGNKIEYYEDGTIRYQGQESWYSFMYTAPNGALRHFYKLRRKIGKSNN